MNMIAETSSGDFFSLRQMVEEGVDFVVVIVV
jgi:hypothetical protein